MSTDIQQAQLSPERVLAELASGDVRQVFLPDTLFMRLRPHEVDRLEQMLRDWAARDRLTITTWRDQWNRQTVIQVDRERQP